MIKKIWHQHWDMSKKVLIEKTPSNVYKTLMIEKQFKNSKFIIMVRNPYCVCEGIRRKSEGKINLTQAATHWINTTLQQMENIKIKNSIYFTYEEFTENNEKIFDKIIKFCPHLESFDKNLTQDKRYKHLVGIESQNKNSLSKLNKEDIDEINKILKKKKNCYIFGDIKYYDENISVEKTFKNKTAIVTGATGGIGEATCDSLEKRGCNVIKTSRNGPDIKADLPKEAYKLKDIQTDILVHCAGGIYEEKEVDLTLLNENEISSLIERNLMSTIMVCKYILPNMRENGSIVLIGTDLVGKPTQNNGLSIYAVAKAGVHELTIRLAKQLEDKNINVNCIAPGFIKSKRLIQNNKEKIKNIGKIKGYGHPNQIGELTTFLCSENGKFITGQIIRMSGNNTHA